MSAFEWYLSRLRTMNLRELSWRSRRAVSDLAPTRRKNPAPLFGANPPDWARALESFRAAADRPVLLDRQRAQAIAELDPTHVSEVIGAADSAVNLSFEFFGYGPVSLRQPIDWHYDPIAQQHWPDRASNRINHRTVSADVKWIWELNRLQHLPWLAQAWLFTGDGTYSRAAFDQLDSWIEQNPPGRGIAWRGAFEAGIRAISIVVALQGLRDSEDLTADRFRRIVGLLNESAERCWAQRSLYSSANNHLVGEMAGLAVVAMMFPDLRSSKLWKRRALNALGREAQKQILTDGAGAEQAVAYQLFTVELIHLVAVLSMQVDGHAPDLLVEAVIRSSSFLASVVRDHEPDPRYGDDDFGFALRLGPQSSRTVRDHLGIVSTSGCGPDGVSTARDTLDAQWLTAASRSGGTAPLANSISPTAENFVAHEAGLVVLRADDRRTTMDVGPLGYLSIAAHGHADALSVTLSVGDEDVISDPGTGSYYGHPEWRAVMRGTRAHPTVCVDGQDQSVAGGPFLWSRHARVTLLGVDIVAGVVDAQHDGYTRLPGRVVHRRWLIAPSKERIQLVIDLINGDGRHSCAQTWPLHPRLEADKLDFGHIVSRGGVAVYTLLHAASEQMVVEQVRGDDVNNLGWWSDRLESRLPAWWLGASCEAELPLVMATLFSPVDGIATEGLSVKCEGNSIDVRWLEAAQTRSVGVDIGGKASVRWDDHSDPHAKRNQASTPGPPKT